MKKYISAVLTVLLIFSTFCAYAEGDNEESMSIEVIPAQAENAELQDIIDETEEISEIIVTESPKADGEFEDNKTADDDIDLYNLNPPSADEWDSAGSMLSGRADFDTLIINDELYAVGGYGSSGYVYTIERYDENTASWINVTSIPKTVTGFSVLGAGDCIYIIGGYINNTYLNDIQIYDTLTGTWTTGTPMLERRDKAASLYTDNKIYVFGGRNAKGIVNSYEYYDIESDTWNKVTSGFDESLIRIGAKANYVNGYVCLSGGLNQKYEFMGVNIYLASDMTQMTQMTYKGKEYVSVTWGKEKALIFTAAANATEYTVSEMIIESDYQDVTNVTLEQYPINAQYIQNVIYNGYLYCVGGYEPASKKYSTNTYKYSVYYGNFISGDGQIDSVVTADGNSITLNVEANKEYYLMVNVKNMSTFDGYTFTIEYPKDSFWLVDGCVLTDSFDRYASNSNIIGTDIRITEKASNGLSFICSEEVPAGKKVSETVNVVCLKANSSGQRTITYRMTK